MPARRQTQNMTSLKDLSDCKRLTGNKRRSHTIIRDVIPALIGSVTLCWPGPILPKEQSRAEQRGFRRVAGRLASPRLIAN